MSERMTPSVRSGAAVGCTERSRRAEYHCPISPWSEISCRRGRSRESSLDVRVRDSERYLCLATMLRQLACPVILTLGYCGFVRCSRKERLFLPLRDDSSLIEECKLCRILNLVRLRLGFADGKENWRWALRSLPCRNCTRWWNRERFLISFRELVQKAMVQ